MIRLTALVLVALAIECGCPFAGEAKNAKQPHVVFVVNEDEYRAAETMSTFAQLLRESVEPVAWTRNYRDGRVFCTSLGAPDGFKSPQFQQILTNAIHWG